jgi:hypothetical protein
MGCVVIGIEIYDIRVCKDFFEPLRFVIGSFLHFQVIIGRMFAGTVENKKHTNH